MLIDRFIQWKQLTSSKTAFEVIGIETVILCNLSNRNESVSTPMMFNTAVKEWKSIKYIFYKKNHELMSAFLALKKKRMENPGIDPGTSHMLSERSTTWANPPCDICYYSQIRWG